MSPEAASEASYRAGHFSGGPERHLLLDHGNVAPPRATTLNRLRAGPKDTIPIVGKPPRKQRSSRFVVTEKVDIERLPPFMGDNLSLIAIYFSKPLGFRHATKRTTTAIY